MANTRVAINGYGRIGRNVLKALYEAKAAGKNYPIDIVAINDLGDAKTNAHLTRYDTAHGRFNATVESDDQSLTINGDRIRTFSERDPKNLPWKDLGVDVVYECTGLFATKETASAHLTAGAGKVIISAPGKNVDASVVYGVNQDILTSDMTVISNASCTTNCLASLAKPLQEKIGIESGLMTTVHSYTNDQRLSDVYHTDLYRARAAAMNMIPTKTGAASLVGKIIPELDGRVDGMAIRVPTLNVSLVDLSFIAQKETSVAEVNAAVEESVAADPILAQALAVNHEPLVSSDFNHNTYTSIFDATQTRVQGRLVKVMSWYDNEWGFSNRMLDTTLAFVNAK